MLLPFHLYIQNIHEYLRDFYVLPIKIIKKLKMIIARNLSTFAEIYSSLTNITLIKTKSAKVENLKLYLKHFC